MAKDRSGPQWTATHRYGDVYECDNGEGITLSHSIGGLQAAKENLEKDGGDFALGQLKHVNAKLEAIERAAPLSGGTMAAPTTVDVETETGTE